MIRDGGAKASALNEEDNTADNSSREVRNKWQVMK
jgi:hypothetical protein